MMHGAEIVSQNALARSWVTKNIPLAPESLKSCDVGYSLVVFREKY
jgi:hypothetical protein